MKRIVSYIITVLMILSLVGCFSKHNEIEISKFDRGEAKNIAMEYVRCLAKGDIDTANMYCTNDLKKTSNFGQFSDLKIKSFKVIEDLEGADNLILTIDVSRSKDDITRSDMDTFNIKVIKEEDKYKINEIKAETKGQVYEENQKLRIIKSEGGKSELLLRQKDVPKDIYPKEEGLTLNKEQVPEGEFGAVTLGFEMNSVAFSIKGEDSSFVGVATVQQVEQAIGTGSSGSAGSGSGVKGDGINIEDILEQPIVDKIMGYDLVNGVVVEKMIFTQDDGQLVVQYSEVDKPDFVRVYGNPNGGLLHLDLEKKFPRGEYDVKVDEAKKDEIVINVTAIGENKEAEGSYIIDTKKETVTKS